jgi:hypothetical protein
MDSSLVGSRSHSSEEPWGLLSAASPALLLALPHLYPTHLSLLHLQSHRKVTLLGCSSGVQW